MVKQMILINKGRMPMKMKVPDDMRIDAYHIKTEDKREVAVIVVQPSLFLPDLVFIHSHPNHPDLGYMVDTYLDMCYNLSIAVIGYDYAGYGQSEGKPSERNQVLEIQAVYEFAVKELQVPWNHIILYGQSIGSGPSVALASDSNYLIGGLIIHSGFMSGLRVIDPYMRETPEEDLFPNIERMG